MTKLARLLRPGLLRHPARRERALAALPHRGWHLQRKASVVELVADWRESLAEGLLPLPHPSPRNQR